MLGDAYWSQWVDDIEDMFSLMQTSLDFDVVDAELAAQIELLEQKSCS